MRTRALPVLAVAAALGAVAGAVGLSSDGGAAPGAPAPPRTMAPPPQASLGPIDPPPERFPRVRYRDSEALGLPYAGRLRNGTQLPARGRYFETWDPIFEYRPNRGWRRWGTDEMVRMVVEVARRYAKSQPGALPMLVGDLSRTSGGDFGPEFGNIGHSTHQNGLDVDVYYPRRDGRSGVPQTPDAVDLRLAQRVVDLFVQAGAETVLVGPNVALSGPADIVKPYPNHDNHLHVRIANPGQGGRRSRPVTAPGRRCCHQGAARMPHGPVTAPGRRSCHRSAAGMRHGLFSSRGPAPRPAQHPHRPDRRGAGADRVRGLLRRRVRLLMADPARPDGDVPPAGEAIHLPEPSYLPVLVAAGTTVALVGVVLNWVVFAIGLAVAVVAILRWVSQTREEIADLPLEHEH